MNPELIFVYLFIFAIVVVIPTAIILKIWFSNYSQSAIRRRMEQDETNRLEREEYEKRETLHVLKIRVDSHFGVEFSTIHHDTTQNEIVRLVNMVGHQAAVACVNQDKGHRRDEVLGSNQIYYLNRDCSSLKADWSEKRNLALQILPKLADRMPHFSEFEPLKSYNAEHLLKKAERRANA